MIDKLSDDNNETSEKRADKINEVIDKTNELEEKLKALNNKFMMMR